MKKCFLNGVLEKSGVIWIKSEFMKKQNRMFENIVFWKTGVYKKVEFLKKKTVFGR